MMNLNWMYIILLSRGDVSIAGIKALLRFFLMAMLSIFVNCTWKALVFVGVVPLISNQIKEAKQVFALNVNGDH